MNSLEVTNLSNLEIGGKVNEGMVVKATNVSKQIFTRDITLRLNCKIYRVRDGKKPNLKEGINTMT